ncbi:MAG: ribonuclease III [Elusimicrobia bacterium]|nr:ribonuclease III [Elusimicrobiota bacterium]
MASIEEVTGYSFKDKELLAQALTHKSYSTERGQAGFNERMEFLGDSVLGLIVSYHLFTKYPGEDEGYLSKVKSALVSRTSLARWAKDLNLGAYVFLGVGESQTGGMKRASILANSLEALIGAVYLDGGIEKAFAFVSRWLDRPDAARVETDYKSTLQELIQKRHKKPPEYEIMHTEGPEHEKVFTVRVRIGRKILGVGAGKNKKEAQQAAARNAFDYLKSHEIQFHEL